MALLEEKVVSTSKSRGAGYVYWLTVIATIGVMGSAFDSVSRNLAQPLILHSLHISVAVGGMIFSAAFIMTSLANIIIGPIVDKWGRKRGFQVALLSTGVFSGLTAFVNSTLAYVLVSFFAGVCLSVNAVGQSMVAEEAPPKIRGLLTGVVQAGFSFGSIIVGLVGNAILPSGNWHLFFLLSFAPIILVFVTQIFVRETPRFLELKAVRQRGIDIDETALQHINVEQARKSIWRQLFAADLRKQTIVISLAGFFINFGSAFVLAFGVEYLTVFDHIAIGTASLAISTEGVATLIGAVIGGILADIIPSRTVLVGYSILGAAGCFLLHWHGSIGWVVLSLCIFGFFGQGALGCFGRYLADSFPTRVRGTGVTFGWAMFFLSSIPAPTVFGLIMGAGHATAAPIVAAFFGLLGGVTFLFGRVILPKRELEEIGV